MADKCYDSESNRRFVVHDLGAVAHIPLRKLDERAADRKGLYRRRQLQVFDRTRYRRRALVETVNRMLKCLSPAVRARSGHGQYVELALRAVAHNARRAAVLESGG